MQRSRFRKPVKVNANGTRVVSHAGVGLLADTAELTGLVPGVSAALRTDAAGASHAFAAACRARGVGFSFGFPVDERIRRIVDALPEQCWHPAIDTDGGVRDGAWVAEAVCSHSRSHGLEP